MPGDEAKSKGDLMRGSDEFVLNERSSFDKYQNRNYDKMSDESLCFA